MQKISSFPWHLDGVIVFSPHAVTYQNIRPVVVIATECVWSHFGSDIVVVHRRSLLSQSCGSQLLRLANHSPLLGYFARTLMQRHCCDRVWRASAVPWLVYFILATVSWKRGKKRQRVLTEDIAGKFTREIFRWSSFAKRKFQVHGCCFSPSDTKHTSFCSKKVFYYCPFSWIL